MADIENEKTYDAVFWTSIVKLKRYFAPLVNEVFGEHFSEKAEVTYRPMKKVVQTPNKRMSVREMDSLAEIFEDGVRKLYHFECQTWPDNTIALRIAEYATASAYMGITQTQEGALIDIPNSAVIVLQGEKETEKSDQMQIRIDYPGGVAEYSIPKLYMTDYDEDTLFRKKLYVLMPFILFWYAPEFDAIEKDPNGIERLRNIINRLFEKLDRSVSAGELEANERNGILGLTERVLEKLAINYENIGKGVKDIMGGELIKTRWDEAEEKNIEKGLEQGLEQGKVSMLIDLVISGDISVQKAADKLGITTEAVEKRMLSAQSK